MMKYMLIIHGNYDAWNSMTPDGIEKITRAHKSVTDELAASGELIETNELSVNGTKVVRTTGGVPAVTDGPFIEVKEILAGYYIIECANIDRAVEIAARLAEAEFAPIEVRQINSSPQQAG
jgi:hypothetical protein